MDSPTIKFSSSLHSASRPTLVNISFLLVCNQPMASNTRSWEEEPSLFYMKTAEAVATLERRIPALNFTLLAQQTNSFLFGNATNEQI
jgi:hypothetical protein